MVEGRSEVLPERRARARIVRREEQREHEGEAEGAGEADADPERQGDPDRQLAQGDEPGPGMRVGKDGPAKDRRDERVHAALQEALDPVAEPRIDELRVGDLVLAEDEEEDAYGDAQQRERAIVTGGYGGHGLSRPDLLVPGQVDPPRRPTGQKKPGCLTQPGRSGDPNGIRTHV